MIYTRYNKQRALAIIFLLTPFYSYSFLGRFISELNEFNKSNRQVVVNNLKDTSSYLLNRLTLSQEDSLEEHDLLITKRSKRLDDSTERVFKNIAGEIPIEVKEIIEFIQEPEKFRLIGAIMPRGILLVGPPGTGKTSIAREIARESGAEFHASCGSQFAKLYVGAGPKRVRDLFKKARASKKLSIIFIDEIDALGGQRYNHENEEYRNTLNELLNQMDGFISNENLIIIGATNTPETLDEALLRPGRFDRIVTIKLPDKKSRIDILRYYIEEIVYDNNSVDLDILSDLTKNMSGADLKNIVNEAAIYAVRKNQLQVTQDHFIQVLETKYLQ